MQVVSMTEAKNNFKEIFDSVFVDNDEVIINKKELENIGKICFNSKIII